MRIIYIIQSIYRMGGTEKATIDQANLIAQNTDHDVHIVSLYKKVNKSQQVSHFIADNIKIHFLHEKIELLKYSDSFYNLIDLLFKPALTRLINSLSPDICIYTSVKLFSHEPSRKSILMAHFRFSHFISGKITKYYLEKNHDKFDKVIFLSEEDMHDYNKHYHIDNGSYIHNYCHIEPKMRSDFSNKTISYIGRIDNSQKQLNHALLIIKKLVEQGDFSGWRLNLYGRGADEEVLLTEINVLDLNAHVFLKGAYSNLDSTLAKTDILILTSKFEGLPLSLIEAGLSGIPLISYDCSPGISAIIKDSYNGYLIEQDNLNDFAQRLASLMNNNERLKEFGTNSLTHMLEHFSQSVILNKWLCLFDDLYKNHKNERISK